MGYTKNKLFSDNWKIQIYSQQILTPPRWSHGDTQTHGQIFTQYSGISSHSKGARIKQ